MKTCIGTLLLFILCIPDSTAQNKIDPATIKDKMQWFADAKLGIFIHAGIYSVNGIDESWSFHNKKISYADYMKQLNGYTLQHYNPDAWADLIKESGARYSVITTKHHDGVAMYDTRMNNLSSVKATPAKKDMIKPFFEALRKRDIKCGAYFSLLDWSHPDYPGFLSDSVRMRWHMTMTGGINSELFRRGRSKRSVLNTILIFFGLTVTGSTVLKSGKLKKSGI